MITYLPKDISVATNLDKIYITEENDKRFLSEHMSSRMVKCASVLPYGEYLGWQIIIPVKGLVSMSLFGTDDVSRSDLEWIVEKAAKSSKRTFKTKSVDSLTELYELYLPIAEESQTGSSIGFTADNDHAASDDFSKWPSYFSSQFKELISVLRQTGAALRMTVGAASEESRSACRKGTLKTYDVPKIDAKDYIGRPVSTRVLLRIPAAPSVRLRSVLEETVQGAKLRYIGNMKESYASQMWEDPMASAPVLPDYAARFMMLEPNLSEPTIGIEICEEDTMVIPASHKNSKDKNAVFLGKATDTTGVKRKITIGETDLKRHYQIVGQTGSGKSTLLSTIILSAIKEGYGLTFFDPHGSTIDTVLKTIPREYADRVRVVRIGDADNPVPLNIWDSDNPVKEEKNISDLCELFGDLFNPRSGELIVGPRYERWLSTFAKASIAFLGRRASLESIAVLSQSQDNMLKLSKAIVKDYPELVETIKQEYGLDNSSDWHSLLGWFLCKFQRLTSVEQLRETLGAGANALEFSHTIDTDTVTLIDLASPVIGTQASRIVGTLLLMKLWNAALSRQKRDKTHLVIVDEASLFQTNPMPRMLAESRKFGIAMILCHQHTGQLSDIIRDALEANSANFSAFRLSPKDAVHAAMRLDDTDMSGSLARLNAFNAITTLSVDGKQTAPFTLETARPRREKDGEEIARYIEAKSIETLVEPYRHLSALTPAEIIERLNEASKTTDKKKSKVAAYDPDATVRVGKKKQTVKFDIEQIKRFGIVFHGKAEEDEFIRTLTHMIEIRARKGVDEKSEISDWLDVMQLRTDKLNLILNLINRLADGNLISCVWNCIVKSWDQIETTDSMYSDIITAELDKTDISVLSDLDEHDLEALREKSINTLGILLDKQDDPEICLTGKQKLYIMESYSGLWTAITWFIEFFL